MFADGFDPPYYAVIFSAHRTSGQGSGDGYEDAAKRMLELGRAMPGYLGFETARGADGFGISVSYWRDEASLRGWKAHLEHRGAQERGKREWYTRYIARIARVERAYQGPEGRI